MPYRFGQNHGCENVRHFRTSQVLYSALVSLDLFCKNLVFLMLWAHLRQVELLCLRFNWAKFWAQYCSDWQFRKDEGFRKSASSLSSWWRQWGFIKYFRKLQYVSCNTNITHLIKNHSWWGNVEIVHMLLNVEIQFIYSQTWNTKVGKSHQFTI